MSDEEGFVAWVAQQMDAAGFDGSENSRTQSIRLAVLMLSKSLADLDARHLPQFDTAARTQALKIFQQVAAGGSLGSNEGHVYVSARQYTPSIGEPARIGLNAYDDERARMLNGRPGRIVALRHGDVIIAFTDDRQPREWRASTHEIEMKVNR